MKYLPIDFNKESNLYGKYLAITIGDLIDIIFSHNEIIELCVNEVDSEDPKFTYHKTIWRGHAHQLPDKYKKYAFLRIFGCVSESIVKSDTIYIECDAPKNSLERLIELKEEENYWNFKNDLEGELVQNGSIER